MKKRNKLFSRQESIGKEEKEAVNRVMDSMKLSSFRGSWNENFYGGIEVKLFEKEFCEKFNVSNSVAVNSCTSALQIACGAIGLQPGDEVIVTPYSMTCSATAPLIWGAVPIFADVEKDYFCLDPKSVEEKITEKTKAIIVVDLFGQPYDWDAINDIAVKHNLFVIEDAAQAIGSKYNGNYAGILGHIGCFSFTQGKHLTAGEGGMITTDDECLAFKCQLIRNHAESVISDMNSSVQTDLISLIGYNMRMTELQAAIMREQLKKLDKFIEQRQQNAAKLYEGICEIPFIKPAKIRVGCTHSYYVQAFLFDENIAGVSRDKFIEAVKSKLYEEEGRPDKGVPIGCGYIKPLNKMPLFQNKVHWALDGYDYNIELSNVEKLWSEELFITTLQQLPLEDENIDDIINAFIETYDNLDKLL